MTPEDLKMIRDRLGYVQAIRRLETGRRNGMVLRAAPPVPAGSDFCRACGQDTESAQDVAALITEVDRLNGLLLDISNTIYTANVNDHGACIVAMAKTREIATKGATE